MSTSLIEMTAPEHFRENTDGQQKDFIEETLAVSLNLPQDRMSLRWLISQQSQSL